MDNKKKEKLVAIVVTALISLAVSVAGCIFGVTPDELSPAATSSLAANPTAYCFTEV